MKVSSRIFRRSSALFRKQRRGFGTGFFLVLSILIFASSKVDHPLFLDLKTDMNTLISPLMGIVSFPVEAGRIATDWGEDLFTVYTVNRSLRSENETLKNWRQVAVNLDLENKRLKDLLKVDQQNIDILVTARVIGVSGGPYVKSILLNAGFSQGVKDNNPVINQLGVVGRAIMVGPSSSRVLLINDLNSRIPIKIERTNQNGIVVGRNDDFLDLMFLPVDKDVVVGDIILTSGDGDVFPPDLMMGEVISIEGNNIRILPAVILDKLNFVSILNFSKNDLELETSQGNENSENGEAN